MRKKNKEKPTAEQVNIEKCICDIDLAASTRENSKEIRKHINAIRKLFADVKAGQKKECWYAKDIFNDDDRKIICEGCEEDCKYNRKETPLNQEYEDLFEQYKQENANWEKYLTDSTYYELMFFYDDKHHINNEDHYSDEGREFANYIWYKYVEETSSAKKNPLSQDFKKFEEAYLEKEKDEILCIYDRHAGLVDGAQWQQQKDREKILLLKDQMDFGHTTMKCIPFKGYARAYETTAKKLLTDPDTRKEVIKEEKIIQFGEFVEDKKNLPDYHEYSVATSKYVGIVKVTIEPEE